MEVAPLIDWDKHIVVVLTLCIHFFTWSLKSNLAMHHVIIGKLIEEETIAKKEIDVLFFLCIKFTL
jgi:hypothetical protein